MSSSTSPAGPTDVVLKILDPYMDQIISGLKNHEFRKYLLPSTTLRIWFYRPSPHSAITHICEIDPVARRRNENGHSGGDLPENGIGNKEFNENHPDWEGYDYAYKILSTWELKEPVSLATMMEEYGFAGEPRKWTPLPDKVRRDVIWERQKKIQGESTDAASDKEEE